MIVRKQPAGELHLIGQTDHSRLVGQVAAHWGNAQFAAPEPYSSMVRAATFHDYGWLRYETYPLLNPESGEPYSFLQAPLSRNQIDSYQWSLDWMAGIDPYAGLIVSMHRTGLWKNNIRDANSEVREFVERNERRQNEEQKTHDPEKLRVNYRLMQIWDLLGLYFCCHDLEDDYVEPVPTGYALAEGVRVTLRPSGPHQVRFDPYPFNVRPCRIQVAFKRLPQSDFADIEAFHRAYFQAESGLMQFELV